MKNHKTTANNPTPKASNFSSSLNKTKDDNSFTLVSYRKSNGGMATRASRAKTNADNGNGNDKMMIASMSNFTKLQQDIFPIIELIARDSKNKDNSLVQTWMQAQTGPNKMTATSNFRCVSKALGLKDLLSYRQFLEALPNIKAHVIFTDNETTHAGFKYSFIPNATIDQNILHDDPQKKMTSTDNTNDDTLNFQQEPSTTMHDNESIDGTDSITTKRSIIGKENIDDNTWTSCYGTPTDLHDMMTTFWPSIEQFIANNPNHDHSIQWQQWITQDNLNVNTELNEFKEIFGVDSLDQLYIILRDSPAINMHHELTWDHKICYRSNSAAPHIPISPAGTNDSQTTDASDNLDHKYFIIHSVADTDPEFGILHKKLYELVKTWAETNEAKCHQHWMQWIKWGFAGLRAIQTADKIKRIMQVADIQHYIDKMLIFPPILQHLHIIKNETDGSIKYALQHLSPTTVNSAAIVQLSQDFHHFMQAYELKIVTLNTQLTDLQHAMIGCEQYMKTHMATYKSKIEKISHDTIDTTLNTINQMVSQTLSIIPNEIANKTATLESDLNKLIDDMIQDIYVATEDANKAMYDNSEHILHTFTSKLKQQIDDHQHMRNSPPTSSNIYPVHTSSTSPRFPNVRLDGNFRRSPNPFDSSASVPDFSNRRHHSSPFMKPSHEQPTDDRYKDRHSDSQRIPMTVQVEHRQGHTDIPPLNHDQALKRAKIQFTGLGDMFVFYNQLMNGMEQFGIFLIPLNTVSYQTDICPTYYQGTLITNHRRTSMASTLYQKLQDTDVIPMDHTAIRNIINRFAESNDGYKVLYAMLELVHPALQKDAVILPPKSEECEEDIHLYAQKFDAWLRYETYANRPYSPREQVNLFIRELSNTFAPAVSRIRRLLDSWNPFNTTVPELLKITSLPNTIERFLMEETGTSLPTIRRAHDKHHQPKRGLITSGNHADNKRITVDKYCHFCGVHGHLSTSCDFMAKLIIANESLKKVDPNIKKDLQESFRKEQRRKRDKKLQKKTNMIRKLLDSGGSREDIEAILESIPVHEDHDYNDHDADESHTTSSSEE